MAVYRSPHIEGTDPLYIAGSNRTYNGAWWSDYAKILHEHAFGLPRPFGVSVGTGDVPVFTPSIVVPPLVPIPAGQSDEPYIPPAVIRTEQTQMPTIWSGSEGSFQDLLNAGHDVVRPPGWGQETLPEPTQPEEEDEPVSWIEDVYTTVDAGLGGWLPGGVAPGSSLPQVVGQAAQQVITNQLVGPTQTPAPVTYQQSAAPTESTHGMVYKKVCGQWKWTKPSRRRRRRVATQQQVKDIAAMKGVLGNGKALETWIATHS